MTNSFTQASCSFPLSHQDILILPLWMVTTACLHNAALPLPLRSPNGTDFVCVSPLLSSTIFYHPSFFLPSYMYFCLRASKGCFFLVLAIPDYCIQACMGFLEPSLRKPTFPLCMLLTVPAHSCSCSLPEPMSLSSFLSLQEHSPSPCWSFIWDLVCPASLSCFHLASLMNCPCRKVSSMPPLFLCPLCVCHCILTCLVTKFIEVSCC